MIGRKRAREPSLQIQVQFHIPGYPSQSDKSSKAETSFDEEKLRIYSTILPNGSGLHVPFHIDVNGVVLSSVQDSVTSLTGRALRGKPLS